MDIKSICNQILHSIEIGEQSSEKITFWRRRFVDEYVIGRKYLAFYYSILGCPTKEFMKNSPEEHMRMIEEWSRESSFW